MRAKYGIWVSYDSVVTVSLNTYISSGRQLPSNLTYRRRERGFGKFWVQIWDQKAVILTEAFRASVPRSLTERRVMTDSVSRCFQANIGGRAQCPLRSTCCPIHHTLSSLQFDTIQGVPGGMCQISEECSLTHSLP